MKRHQALVLLSRDHHDGLLLAVRLQQGKNALERLWSHDPMWQAEYVVKFFEDHLIKHFEEEEQFLFPLAEKYFPQHNDIVTRLRNDHEQMRKAMPSFRAPELNRLTETLTQFGKLLEEHIRCEEREFFPLLEQYLDENTLQQAGNNILHHHSKVSA